MKNLPKIEEMQTLNLMAKSAWQSGFYKSLGGQDAILAIMLLAREYDLPPMQALSGGIWNIQGKIEISARFMNMMIRREGHKLNIERSDEKGCVITGERKDTQETYTASFLEEDAIRAQLVNKQQWLKHPKDMYFARAISTLARKLFPDVIGNSYVEGEGGEIIVNKDSEQPDMNEIIDKYAHSDNITSQLIAERLQMPPALTPSQPPLQESNGIQRELLVKILADTYNCSYDIARQFILMYEEKKGSTEFYKTLKENPKLCEKQIMEFQIAKHMEK